jgi:hypothetical protein
MKIYKCDLCHKNLPEIVAHSYPYTACDECFDMAGNAERLVQFIKARREIDEEKEGMLFYDLIYNTNYAK